MHGNQNKFLESSIECMSIVRGMNLGRQNKSLTATASNGSPIGQKSCTKKCSNKVKGQTGYQASVWGPGMWFFLHTMSLNYPLKPTQADKRKYAQFLRSLGHVLPCSSCSEHCKDYFQKYFDEDAVLSSRESLAKWLYEFHESVNMRLDKGPSGDYTSIMSIYERFAVDQPNHITNLVFEPVQKNR